MPVGLRRRCSACILGEGIMKKLFICISAVLLTVALTASSVFAASYSSFKDASGHWAADYLKRAVENGVLNGSGGKLKPDDKLTGAQMTAIITRDCGLQLWTDAYPGAPASTHSKNWYYASAAAAYTAGLLPADASVSMEGSVTREQVFEIFAKAYMGLQPDEEDTSADDETDEPDTDNANESNVNGSADTASDAAEKNGTENAVNDENNENADIDDAQNEIAGIDNQLYPNLSKFSDAVQMSESGKKAAEMLVAGGIVNGDNKGFINPLKGITRAEFVTMLYRIKDSGAEDKITYSEELAELGAISINIKVTDAAAGGSVKAEASFSGIPEGTVFDAKWYLDGVPVSRYSASGKQFTDASKSNFMHTPTYSLHMQLYHRMGLELICKNGNQTVHIYNEKTANVTNYPQSHYLTLADGVAVTQIFDSVRSSYQGNYKSSYNPDYLDATKEAFVNSKGYSSKTQYLLWANLATQKVNVFKGSKGNWQLVKAFRMASGARSTPTPQGVTYVTYKQTAWKTSSYVCKPIVRFYPGTGYAFHSILYKADESGIKDGSIGFPVSHGCLRMKPASIQWIYNNIPVNTTVVIY